MTNRFHQGRPATLMLLSGLMFLMLASSCLAQTSLDAGAAGARDRSLWMERIGSERDAKVDLRGPAFYLKGDGPPDVSSFDDFARLVANAPVDVVILGGSFADYDGECRSLLLLKVVNSCTTIVVRDTLDANDPLAVLAVERAEVVYFRGGDQCNFVRWKYTDLYNAVKALGERGGGIGGGSAGLAIQGSLAVYDGCTGSISSDSALLNPTLPSMSFTVEYFEWPHLDGLVTDSHFVKRDRMGRLITFLCRQQALGRAEEAWGLGLNDQSVMLIDAEGKGTVYGSDAYLVLADGDSSGCSKPMRPVDYEGIKVWRFSPGSRLDFADRPKDGFYRVSVRDGKFEAPPY